MKNMNRPFSSSFVPSDPRDLVPHRLHPSNNQCKEFGMTRSHVPGPKIDTETQTPETESWRRSTFTVPSIVRTLVGSWLLRTINPVFIRSGKWGTHPINTPYTKYDRGSKKGTLSRGQRVTVSSEWDVRTVRGRETRQWKQEEVMTRNLEGLCEWRDLRDIVPDEDPLGCTFVYYISFIVFQSLIFCGQNRIETVNTQCTETHWLKLERLKIKGIDILRSRTIVDGVSNPVSISDSLLYILLLSCPISRNLYK